MMKPATANIINIASSENGKILITDTLIRLAFQSKEQAVRFIQAVQDMHPSVNVKAHTLNMCHLDIANPEAA